MIKQKEHPELRGFMPEFFNDEQNMAELVSHMPEEDRRRYTNFGHRKIEPAFVNRVFIVYKPTGLTASGEHKQPEILNLVKVADFFVDPREGAHVVFRDQNTQQELTISHVPRRVYEYPIYVSVPTELKLRWDARTVNNRVWRSMSFAVLVKTKNRSDFYSKGNVYFETPNSFKRLYPSVTGDFKF
jgi:hypothetical protein